MNAAPVTVSELLSRARGRGDGDRQMLLDLRRVGLLATDPFWVWADRHAPAARAVDEEREYDRLQARRGIDFREGWVRQHHPNALRIAPAPGQEALIRTLKAMREGVRVICHPHLAEALDGAYGHGDLLVRDDGQSSDLGNFAYSVVEIRGSACIKTRHVLQAACVHHIVSIIQGRTLERFKVVLPAGEIHLPYRQSEDAVRNASALWQRLIRNEIEPDPIGIDKTASPWRVFGNDVLRERQDLTLLPGVGPRIRERIREAMRVRDIRGLIETSPGELIGALGPKLGTQVYYGCIAYRRLEPIVVPGMRVTVPRGRRATFALDFETSDALAPALAQPPHGYLAGLWDFQDDRFIRFLARGPGEEARMFEEMLEYVGDPSEVRVHTWTAFENGVLRQAAGRHPRLAGRLAAFEASCVDLKKVLKQQIHIPAPSWSIKHVAPALGFHWRHRGFGAFDSMTAYWKWLETGDDILMAKPLDYHEDDVRAMAHIVRVLEGREG